MTRTKLCIFWAVIVAAFSTAGSAAPSLPITKPPVTPVPSYTGPTNDPHAVKGQWFHRLNSQDPDRGRVHEFYDNTLGSGGGPSGDGVIYGYVSRIEYSAGANSPIIAFDVEATIINDTVVPEDSWPAGTNSHGEALNTTDAYVGTMFNTVLTVDFALSDINNLPAAWQPPYRDSQPYVIATNSDEVAWYCWTPGAPDSPQGGYFVPAWDFGDIIENDQTTRTLSFVVPAPGLPLADRRYNIIVQSYFSGSDILLNRTVSLKTGRWIEDMVSDNGGSNNSTNDASVFHDVYDFGDLPNPPYPTLLADNGARHVVVPSIRLGPLIDAESDGQPNSPATGDDAAGLSDEDGVTPITGPLAPGQAAQAQVLASTNGYLSAWIDFNGDGTWTNANENIFSDLPLSPGANTLSFSVPADANTNGPAYGRFRFSTQPGLSYNGPAPDGEVEDYAWPYGLPPNTQEASWYRPPDLVNGTDLESSASPAESDPAGVKADDFIADGRPVTAIRWWGSYIGYQTNAAQPVPPPPNPPYGFRVQWFTDVPAGFPTNYSFPALPAAVTVTGTLFQCHETYYTNVFHSWNGAHEHEFVYDLVLTNSWKAKAGHTYWVSISALYADDVPASNRWGWATTPLQYNWNDDAVNRDKAHPIGWQPLTYAGIIPTYGTNSVNMAVALYTDVIGRRTRNWAQPPDMATGENMPSYTNQYQPAQWSLRADDFVSDGRRIADVHWWGSYLGYRTNDPGPVEHPNPAITPIGFNLSWHRDVPENPPGQVFSKPGDMITNVFIPFSECNEVFYGSVTQSWKGAYDHEFQYYVDLKDPNIPGIQSWCATNGVVYWLNIQAVFTSAWQPGAGGHSGWGWKTTPWLDRWNDDSVVNTNVSVGWQPAAYPPGNPNLVHTQFCDLAFELTTDQAGTSRWSAPIVITNISLSTGATGATVVSVGDAGAGVQVLQCSTNLLNTNNWTDLATNALPLPPPFANWWFDAPLARTTEFYRVLQR